MIAKKSNKIFVSLFFVLAFLVSLFVGGINVSQTNAADSGQANSFFQVETSFNGMATSAKTTKTIYYSPTKSAKAYIYDTTSISEFSFKFDFSQPNLWGGEVPGVDTAGTADTSDDKYTLKLEVQFLKGYARTNIGDEKGASFTDDAGNLSDEVVVSTEKTHSVKQENGWKSLDNYHPTWTIHANHTVDDNGTIKTIAGWGIYRFKMTVGNNISAYSDFFIVEPTMEVGTKPVVTINNDSIEKTIFQVSQNGDYKYIDPNRIVWYVYGKNDTGDRYALLKSDLDTDKFKQLECNKFLHENLPNTGYYFELPTPTYDGEWHVWCEYTPFASPATMKSDEYVFIIGQPLETFPYYWIIIAVAAVGICITVIFISVNIKHEKIY